MGLHYMTAAQWVACVAFPIAFALTFVRDRRASHSAAALFCIGSLTKLGALAVRYFPSRSSTPVSEDGFAIIGLFVSLWAICYTVGAALLLLPSISQRR